MAKAFSEEAGSSGPAPRYVAYIPVELRDGKSPLACWNCLAKHISAAYRQFVEYNEDRSRQAEKLLCLGNLLCAKEHAEALKCTEVSDMCRVAIGELFGDCNLDAEGLLLSLVDNASGAGMDIDSNKAKAIGYLAAAEDYARLAGDRGMAERIRAARIYGGAGDSNDESNDIS